MRKSGPWQIVNVPSVVEFDIREAQRYGTFGLAEGCAEEI